MTTTTTTAQHSGAAREPGRRRGRAARLLSALLVLGLAGGVTAAAGVLPERVPGTVPPTAVEVDPATTTLVCPGPLRLPDDATSGASGFDRVPVAPRESVTAFGTVLAGAASLTPLGGTPTALDAGTGALASPTVPTVLTAEPVAGEPARVAGVTSSVVTDGDLRGLSAGACARPASDIWLVGGSTALESTADLVVVNPGSTVAEVTLELWGPSGAVDLAGGADLLVAPGGQQVVVLPGIAAEQRRLVVHVSAAGGQVSAYLQDALLDGFTPQGVDLVTAGAAPATRQVIAGISVPAAEVGDPDAGSLRLLALGEDGATASVRLLGAGGDVALPGAEAVELATGEVTDVSLGGLATGVYTAVVESTGPVVAGASIAREGRPGELDQGPRLERAWVPATSPGGGLVAVPAGTTAELTLASLATASDGEPTSGPTASATPSPEPTQGQRPDADAGTTGPSLPTVEVTVRAYGAGGVLAEQVVAVPVGGTVLVRVDDLVAGAAGADAVVGVEVVADDQDEVAWALVTSVVQSDGALLSVVAPLADAQGVTRAEVREGQRVGLD